MHCENIDQYQISYAMGYREMPTGRRNLSSRDDGAWQIWHACAWRLLGYVRLRCRYIEWRKGFTVAKAPGVRDPSKHENNAAAFSRADSGGTHTKWSDGIALDYVTMPSLITTCNRIATALQRGYNASTTTRVETGCLLASGHLDHAWIAGGSCVGGGVRAILRHRLMKVAALDAVEGSFDNQDEEDEAADFHAAEVTAPYSAQCLCGFHGGPISITPQHSANEEAE